MKAKWAPPEHKTTYKHKCGLDLEERRSMWTELFSYGRESYTKAHNGRLWRNLIRFIDLDKHKSLKALYFVYAVFVWFVPRIVYIFCGYV